MKFRRKEGFETSKAPVQDNPDLHNPAVLNDILSRKTPMLTLSAPLLTVDIVRAKSFDSSSKLLNPSLRIGKSKITSSFQEIEQHSHCTSSDRIARLMNITSAGLTMAQVTKIVKLMALKAPIVITKSTGGINIAATAPDAFVAPTRIQEVALSETGKFKPKSSKKELQRPLPSVSSPLAMREEHRLIRSQPNYTTIKPIKINLNVSNSMGSESFAPTHSSSPAPSMKNFDDWNPESISSLESKGQMESFPLGNNPSSSSSSSCSSSSSSSSSLSFPQYSTSSFSPSFSSSSLSSLTSSFLLEHECSILDRLKKTSESYHYFNLAIDAVQSDGVPSAAGSGHRLPVIEMNEKCMESIITRISTVQGFLSSSEIIQHFLDIEMEEVMMLYRRAVSQATVLYDLRDEKEAQRLHISPIHFYDSKITSLWSNEFYQLNEWRVLRETGIDSRLILSIFKTMNSIHCNSQFIMLELQYLWYDGKLPEHCWENLSGSFEKSTYKNLLLTDVKHPRFIQHLPMSLEDFVDHVDSTSKNIRELLCEHWLLLVAEKLSRFIGSMKDPHRSLQDEIMEDPLVGLIKSLHQPHSQHHEGDDDEESLLLDQDLEGEENGSNRFQKFKQSSAAKAKSSRLKLELDQSKKSTSSKNMSSASRLNGSALPISSHQKRNKAERVIDCASVLCSRQLRGMCEDSLVALTQLLDRLTRPETAPYSIFVVNLRLRKRKNHELTSEFIEPVEVCLQPSLSEFKNGLTACVQSLVAGTRNFIRPEQVFGKDFGGANNALVSKLLQRTRFLKMNECSVSLSDSIVHDNQLKLHQLLQTYFEGPTNLLKIFSGIEKFLSGKLADSVSQAIRDCVTNNNQNSSSQSNKNLPASHSHNSHGHDVVDNLQILSTLCKELDEMVETIKHIVPDVCHFPMFEIRCADLKDILIKQVKLLHTNILDAVNEENKIAMGQINNKYSEISNVLVAEVTDSAELKALQEFTIKAATTLNELYDQYVTVCYERIKFLLAQKQRFFSREDIAILYSTYYWPQNIQGFLKRSYEMQSSRKKELEELLEDDSRKLENDINDLAKRIETVAENDKAIDFRKNCERIAAIKRDIDSKIERGEEILERETLLEMPHCDHLARLEEVKANVEPLDRLWNTVKTFFEKSRLWHETPVSEIDPEEAERTAEELHRALIKVGKEFERQGEKRLVAKRIADGLQQEIKSEFINECIPLMLLVCNHGMRDRHWQEIEALTGVVIPKGEPLTISILTDIGLQHHVKAIEDVCTSASKEYSLQVAMDKMESEWKNMIFETKEHRTPGTRILHSVDEIQQMLDDHIVKTQAMKSSRYIKPFLEQILRWEETLISMQDILDNWLKVQNTWLYLEPIFSSDDIMRQMPAEGRMFRAVDNTWKISMAQTFAEPSCVKVARRPGFLDSLIEANSKLELIQKGLNDYLETKRLSFPRFFFLSNEELLEILAETKDPLKVQPHLKKCFDGIAKLQFHQNLDIVACFDAKDERLDFPYEKINQRKINPNDSGGNVERWLIEVEITMKKSLAYATDFAMKDYLESDRIEWLSRWQGQVIIAINQISWCFQVEKTLTDGILGKGLGGYHAKLCDELMRTVELVRGNIPKALRVAIGALVVMDVHNRDVVDEMNQLGVTLKNEFDWLSQLRYYWKEGGESAQSGKPGTIHCHMINAVILYAYEYIGNQDRLVITPLTDRCYRTLMGAIHLNLGGAPEGPAGTGKTETTKDLAKAIAIQCVVTNCSDGLDYLAMAKFFKGLASSGAWACFDEFNRIQLEVLSVIAQQIHQIQMAKIKHLEKFFFEGTELILQPTCCPFITMNPGYAGRAELPDNLKVLFRTVAMMVPDYAMISEIILYSYGYMNAKPLAVKIVTTYKLCSEQLSSQSHYDYGMRAVIAVLRAAGNLKRSDGHLSEDVLVLRSIIDVNLPKFLSPDVPLFNGITSDLFPGIEIEPPDRSKMHRAFQDACEKKSLIPESYFWDKVVQIYDMMVVRHGFMVVGMPYSGKTSAWKILAETLGLLAQRYPQDKKWSKVIPFVQNPKSITMGQLYGQFDPVSHEWTDGVLSINYRNAATNKVGDPEDRKWILFDGPVDAIWIENMNTVLDDNKKLCLMSGEIIAMSDGMSMIFEPMDLLVASPATVSRCGMIYMEPEKLGWKPLLESWFQMNCVGGKFLKNPAEAGVTSGARKNSNSFIPLPVPTENVQQKQLIFDFDVQYVQSLFDWFVDPCLCFLRKEGTEMVPSVDSNLVMSLLNIFEIVLRRSFVKYKDTIPDKESIHTVDSKTLRQRTQDIECCFFFALMWSIGKTGTSESQKTFSSFMENYLLNIDCLETSYLPTWNALQIRGWKKPDVHSSYFKGVLSLPMPMKFDYYEFVYSPEDSKWKLWSELLTMFSIAPNTPYNYIIVPNNYTAQSSFALELLLPAKKHVLVCGPTGTGKTVYIQNTITSVLPQDLYKPLSLGFSAKTSANMTQDIIDGKLEKRRKGIYGPPSGTQSLIFVDDLNLPEVEVYGAQPPIELLRQLVDNGGWYDIKDKTWKSIVDTTLVAAMGPPGGGKNHVTPRLIRYFNIFCFSEFDDNTLRRIFQTIVRWHFDSNNFSTDVQTFSDAVVEATLDTYRSAMSVLLPTPQKSHYTFNLRDFSRVIQGVLLSSSSESFDKSTLIRLWSHEALRVFGDRLIDDQDREWFHQHLESTCITKFQAGFYETFSVLETSNDDDSSNHSRLITFHDMRRLMFGDYLNIQDDSRKYVEIKDLSILNEKMNEFLTDFNQQSRKQMDLVLFNFAIEHISRICRVLKMPGGNMLLVGMGGSGRQSLTRLATFINDYTLFQIEISKNYTNADWREDLKSILKGAGTGSQPFVFLFSDTQIKNETFVEDINNMLNSGEVPNIFPSDEKIAICENVRPFAKQVFGKVAADMSSQDLYSFFIKRIKQNLHIVLAFSPIGEAFRDRLRKFPALINCCTIDWFTAWPSDALVAVAQKFLSEVKFESDSIRSAIVMLCQTFHQDVIKMSDEFRDDLKRQNYVTPTSYLELIMAFKQNLDLKRIEVSQAQKRYDVGLEKLAFAAEQVNKMQIELASLQPQLIESAAATEVLMGQIEQKMPGVLETRKIVSAEASVVQKEADEVTIQKNEVECDLAEAKPILDESIAALNTIQPKDINEIKAMTKPPEKIRMACKAICVMLDIKPVRIPDPENPSKRIMDFWGPSIKMLQDVDFIKKLLEYDKDNINPRIILDITKEFISDPNFNPEAIKNASFAALGMCKWVHAMIQYDRVAKIVGPKKEALREAEAKLSATLAALTAKKEALQKVEDDLKALTDQLEAAKQKKADLEESADLCDKKITRANQLLDGLGGERDRWYNSSKILGERLLQLTGDVLISAAVLAYLGPFTAVYRQRQLAAWSALLKEEMIPCSMHPTLAGTLGDPVKIRQWNIDGLPTDGFSVDNGIVVFNARRWPLMIDPQGQANKWIRNMEKHHSLQVIKLTDNNYLRVLENSIQFGNPVLLENIGEELDPSLEPILQKQLFKQGGVNCIRLSDSTVEYSEFFRFYITTKLRNPHYLPEISVKVTLLNFMITPEGLQDQLLGIVVSQERPDLEGQRNQLVIDGAENKRLLKEIEDKILFIMSSSTGNILEDETAITTLKNSKTLSDEISAKQAVAEDTEKNIDAVRQSYLPVAYSSQILFFCIADLANIEPVYQYSLTWFINLFISSIKNSEKGRDVAKRLENLDTHFTYSLYKNVCRSLLEKDKLLFSFLLSIRIMKGKGLVDPSEWFYLLTGGMATENHHPNPASKWLSQKNWDAVCRLSLLVKYKDFRDDFTQNIDSWKIVYDSLTPQDELFPGLFAGVKGIARLCALRTIRSDKVVLAIQKFVSDNMGDAYVKPPSFDLQACYQDSASHIPLIFILSAGSDPMSSVLRAAEVLKTIVDPISLGQGQGPKAEKLIQRAKEKGTWVVLQNCHLAPSWMPTLEKICEELDPEEIHASFRIWCTTYPSDVFPVTVLQNGVKMTNEPPKGIRSNLLGSFQADPIANEGFFDSCPTKGPEFRRLLFGLCFFHALTQERRLYGPLGWNIPYEFNESDLRISAQQLVLFLNETGPETTSIPFKALRYTAGECNYGGRVTDDKDRRTLMCILNRFYSNEFLDEHHLISPSGLFKCPSDGSREQFISFIDGLPLVAPPDVFGLHDNATLTKDQNDTNALLNSILDTEGGGGGGGGKGEGKGGELGKDQTILSLASEISGKIPENFDMEAAYLKYPVLWEESMNTVLCQELIRFNGLLSLIRLSLANVQKAVKGLVVMSSELDIFGNSLYVNRIPAMWKSRSYPSLKPLSSYVADLHERLLFFSEWMNQAPPVIFWISGFFFTQAFLTGSAQNFARKYTIPIDEVVFDFEMKSQDRYSTPPVNGVFTKGLFLEGARWDKKQRQLAESHPKILFAPTPIMHWVPYNKKDIPTYPHYKCPVYKTSDRRGVLATTGHSSNFVCYIHIPSLLDENHWIERGVAMLTQLDD